MRFRKGHPVIGRIWFYVTPMDGSEEMCKLAEVNTDKEVLQMTYDEMEFDDVFDGIWRVPH